MNISEINNKIECMETELKELKTALKEEKEREISAQNQNSKWKPKMKEIYYYPITGQLFAGCNGWNYDRIDNHYYNAGMVYHTAEEATEAGKRIYYRHWYESMSDITPQMWEDGDIYKWSAYWCYFSNHIYYEYCYFARASNAYFTSEAKCRETIDTIGEDNFIRYVLGIVR